MKPYGREKKLQGRGPWKKDYHPPNGYVNWWENICDFLSRTTMKKNWKKDVDNELNK